MAIPSIYINLEDDVSQIVSRLKHNSAKQVVLVCPKRCLLFSDSINLRLLKKQADVLGKEIFVLTMDEKGQMFAQEAGFQLKFLPKIQGSHGFSDVRPAHKKAPAMPRQEPSALSGAVSSVKKAAQKLVPAKISRAVLHESPVQTPVLAAQRPIRHHEEPRLEVTDTVFFGGEAFEPEKKHKRANATITGIVAVSLILVLLLVFVILPKATVVVYPKTEPVTRDMEINMSPNLTAVDVSKLTMPATKVDQSINLDDKFQDTGQKQVGNKATGTVKIYNFTKLPLNLKAATTILTAGGKTYNLTNDVIDLKPTTYSNSRTKEVDPASLGDSVEITAADGGEDSNLPAGVRLEITNQVLGSKPQVLYAKTDSEVTGGTTRYLSLISADDTAAAMNSLKDKAAQQIRDKLAAQGLVLPDGAYSFIAPQFTTDNPVGSETPSFTANLQARVVGIAFNKNDFDNLIFQRIEQTLASNKNLQKQPDTQITYSVKSFDPNTLVAVIVAHYEGQDSLTIDLPNLAPELVGKSQSDVNEILRSKAEIDRVDITLAPAWQKNFPLFASKIKIVVVDPNSQSN